MRYGMLPVVLIAGLTASCKSGMGGRDGDTTRSVNTVTKSYAKPTDEVWRSVIATVKDLDLTVDRDEHDALGGNLVARRQNKEEIYIDARSVDAQNTQVSVAVEPGDKNLAQIVHDRIADKMGLNLGVARTASPAGSEVEGTYDQKVDACLNAAEKAMTALKLPTPRREVHDTWARVDSRQLDAIPVQIRMERTRKDQTHVVFTVGTGASDDNRTLANRLKEEFERSLQAPGDATGRNEGSR